MADLGRDPQRQHIPGPVRHRRPRPTYAGSRNQGADGGDQNEVRLQVRRE